MRILTHIIVLLILALVAASFRGDPMSGEQIAFLALAACRARCRPWVGAYAGMGRDD